MPARVVYLSAAAAVEDSGICVGRGGGLFGASLCSGSEPAVFILHTHIAVQLRGRLPVCLFTVHGLMHLCLSGME